MDEQDKLKLELQAGIKIKGELRAKRLENWSDKLNGCGILAVL